MENIKKIPVPFFSADNIYLSIQWNAHFHGKFVAKIWAEHPTLNFVVDPNGKNDQLIINKIWVKIVKTLFRLNFKEINIHKARFLFAIFRAIFHLIYF